MAVYLNRKQLKDDKLMVLRNTRVNGETLYECVIETQLRYHHFEEQECAGEFFVLDVNEDGKAKVAHSVDNGRSIKAEDGEKYYIELQECAGKAFVMKVDGYLERNDEVYSCEYNQNYMANKVKLQECAGKAFALGTAVDGKIIEAYSFEHDKRVESSTSLEMQECAGKAFAMYSDKNGKTKTTYSFEDGEYSNSENDHLELQNDSTYAFVLDRDVEEYLCRYKKTGTGEWVYLMQKRKVDQIKEINGCIYLFEKDSNKIYDRVGVPLEF